MNIRLFLSNEKYLSKYAARALTLISIEAHELPKRRVLARRFNIDKSERLAGFWNSYSIRLLFN